MGLCDGVRPYSPAERPVKSWGPLHTQTGSRKNLSATGYWAEQELRRAEQGVKWECLCSAVRPAMQSCRRLYTLQCSDEPAWCVAYDASLALWSCSYGSVVLWNSSGSRNHHVLAQCHHSDRLGTHIGDYRAGDTGEETRKNYVHVGSGPLSFLQEVERGRQVML